MAKIKLRFNAGVEYKNKIYASAININGLFQLDLTTYKVTYIKNFSKEKPCYAIHRTAFLYKNEAWFIPQNGQYIAIANLDTLEMEYLEVPYQRINENAVLQIGAVYYSGDIIGNRYLYLIPTNIDTLLLIDLEDKVLYPYYNVALDDEYFLFGTYANKSIYLFPRIGRSLVKLDLKTNRIERYPWEYPFGSFLEVVCFNNKLYFCPFYSEFILIRDLNTEKEEIINLNEFYDSECNYEQIQIYKDKLFFIPFKGNKILELEIDNNQLNIYKLPERFLENGSNGFTKLYSENQMILASYQKGLILIFNEEKKEFQKIDLRIESDILINEIESTNGNPNIDLKKFFCEEIYVTNGCCKEEFWGIDGYIKKNRKRVYLDKFINKSGEKIWKILK